MSIRVTYSTEALHSKNGDQAGTQCERDFSSIDTAKSASLPDGYSFAYFPIDDGYYVYSSILGWEFHATEPQANAQVVGPFSRT